MTPTPLYNSQDIRPAYQLRYGWTGWPTLGSRFRPEFSEAVTAVVAQWEADGLRLLEQSCCAEAAQLVFSAKPHVAPALLAGRVKGRLQHSLRQMGRPVAFSRKLAVRSIGDNHREDVEQYIRNQVANARFADPEFARRLQHYTLVDPDVDLTAPTETLSGRYWYNLHVVLVNEERYQRADDPWLATIFAQSLAIATKKGHAAKAISVMPDHLHMALRGNVERSPEEVAMAFQNNLAYALGQLRVWQPTYYVGTFSEYDMQAVQHNDESAGR
jgi:REP element-mobilizing transposase RayT